MVLKNQGKGPCSSNYIVKHAVYLKNKVIRGTRVTEILEDLCRERRVMLHNLANGNKVYSVTDEGIQFFTQYAEGVLDAWFPKSN